MLPPNAQLGLSAAVHLNVVFYTILDGIEEALKCAESRGFDIEPLRFEQELFNTLHARDRCISRDSMFDALEKCSRLVGENGIFDEHIRKILDETSVEIRIRGLVNHRPVVLSFEIENPNGIGIREFLN